MSYTKQRVSLIEYGVFSYPEGLEGWRCYREEIGGHAESCRKECTIWLPPGCTVNQFEEWVNGAQQE